MSKFKIIISLLCAFGYNKGCFEGCLAYFSAHTSNQTTIQTTIQTTLPETQVLITSIAGNQVYGARLNLDMLVSDLMQKCGAASIDKLVYRETQLHPALTLRKALQDESIGKIPEKIELTLVKIDRLSQLKLREQPSEFIASLKLKFNIADHNFDVVIPNGTIDFVARFVLHMFTNRSPIQASSSEYEEWRGQYETCFQALLANKDINETAIFSTRVTMLPTTKENMLITNPPSCITFLENLLDGAGISDEARQIVERIRDTINSAYSNDKLKACRLLYVFLHS